MIRKFFGFLFVLFLIAGAISALREKSSNGSTQSVQAAPAQREALPRGGGDSFRTGGLHTGVGKDGRVVSTPGRP